MNYSNVHFKKKYNVGARGMKRCRSNTDYKSSEPLKTLVMLCYVMVRLHSFHVASTDTGDESRKVLATIFTDDLPIESLSFDFSASRWKFFREDTYSNKVSTQVCKSQDVWPVWGGQLLITVPAMEAIFSKILCTCLLIIFTKTTECGWREDS